MSDVPDPRVPESGARNGPGRLLRFWSHFGVVTRWSLVATILTAILCYLGPLALPIEEIDFAAIGRPIDLFSAHPLGTDELGFDRLTKLLREGQGVVQVAAILLAVLAPIDWVDRARARRQARRSGQ